MTTVDDAQRVAAEGQAARDNKVASIFALATRAESCTQGKTARGPAVTFRLLRPSPPFSLIQLELQLIRVCVVGPEAGGDVEVDVDHDGELLRLRIRHQLEKPLVHE